MRRRWSRQRIARGKRGGPGVWVVYHHDSEPVRAPFKEVRDEVTQREDDFARRWGAIGNAAFSAKRDELMRAKADYERLPTLRAMRLQRLGREIRAQQLNRFLKRYYLVDANISGVGPARQATLLSFGIKTAGDIDVHRVARVPGIGDACLRRLITWRDSLDGGFVFDPAAGVDPRDRATVDTEIALERRRLENILRNCVADLRVIATRI